MVRRASPMCVALLAVLVCSGGCDSKSSVGSTPSPHALANPGTVHPPTDLTNLPRARAVAPMRQSNEGKRPAELTPIDAGPGLLIAEPEGTAALRAFGAGCGRWLHLNAGSQKEFGSTPAWSSVADLSRELGINHVRLLPKHLKDARRCLGVSHVGIGSISGSPENANLSFRLYETKSGKVVGKPVAITGSRESIRAGLPGLAKKLIGLLGVTASPGPVAEKADELATLGSIPWNSPRSTTRDQFKTLDKLEKHSPVALVMMVALRQAAVNHLILTIGDRKRPHWQNLMISSEYAHQGLVAVPRFLRDATTPYLEGLFKSYPNNYLISVGLAVDRNTKADYVDARALAEHAVRCAPESPQAWSVLAAICRNHASAIRQARTSDNLSDAEMGFCQKLYDDAQAYSKRAVDLDSRSSVLWRELSNDAMFAGDDAIAKSAIERAILLEEENPLPDDPQCYRWAFQIYQPKWLGDQAAARRLAPKAIAAMKSAGAYWKPQDRVHMATGLAMCGEWVIAEKLVTNKSEYDAVTKALGGK
jgi:tetratricopeptide (TPR) repeat protein